MLYKTPLDRAFPIKKAPGIAIGRNWFITPKTPKNKVKVLISCIIKAANDAFNADNKIRIQLSPYNRMRGIAEKLFCVHECFRLLANTKE